MAPMKFGVVSDIHGNLPALQAVVADAGAVDGWLNLGDILSSPLWPAETADWLMARPASEGWLSMAGNHERQVLTQPLDRMGPTDRHTAAQLAEHHRAWMRGLPASLRPHPGVLCVHGTPATDLVYLLEVIEPGGRRLATPDEAAARLGPVDAELVLCGHSHVPRDVTVAGVRIVNPGSVGLQAYSDTHPFAHEVENGSPQARYALIERGADGWQVQLRAIDYDWEAAALQAQRHGRLDWAHALRTGRVGGRRSRGR